MPLRCKVDPLQDNSLFLKEKILLKLIYRKYYGIIDEFFINQFYEFQQ